MYFLLVLASYVYVRYAGPPIKLLLSNTRNMSDQAATAPLLAAADEQNSNVQRSGSGFNENIFRSSRRKLLKRCSQFLNSRRKHFLVMAVVALDVAALLANVFIKLIACELDQSDEEWVQGLSEGIEIAGLIFSSFFMVELAACLFTFGLRYVGSPPIRYRPDSIRLGKS